MPYNIRVFTALRRVEVAYTILILFYVFAFKSAFFAVVTI